MYSEGPFALRGNVKGRGRCKGLEQHQIKEKETHSPLVLAELLLS